MSISKNKKMILTFMSITMMISSGLTSYAAVESFNQNSFSKEIAGENEDLDSVEIPVKDYGCSKSINKLLSEIEYYLNIYDTSNNLVYLKKSMELFGEIAVVSTEDDLKYFEGETNVYIYFDKIRSYIYNINDANTSKEYLVDFGKEVISGWRKNKISIIFPEYYLIIGLVEYNEYNENGLKEAQLALNDLRETYYYLINSKEENTDSEELPEIEESPDYEIKPLPPNFGVEDDYVDGSVNDSTNDESLDTEFVDDNYTVEVNYKKIGNTCILVETKYKKGIAFEQSEKSVPKNDYVYCGIYDYIFDEIDTVVNNNSNDSNIFIDEGYILNNQNENSDKFLFYTVTKDELVPYYYNSGIRATSRGTLSYNQFRDGIYQVVIKTGGFSTDSNNKSLFVIDGIPIVINSEKNTYSKQEVENFLDSFEKIDFKIEKELDSWNNELKDIIEKGDMVTVNYKDKEFLISNLYIKNSNIMAPISEVVGHFGYKVSTSNKKLTISNKDYKLNLTLNETEYALNGEKGEFKTKVVKKNNQWYAELGKLMELIGYDIKWDSELLCFDAAEINKEYEYLDD